eukprot:2796653-Amphidinium_carterae.1
MCIRDRKNTIRDEVPRGAGSSERLLECRGSQHIRRLTPGMCNVFHQQSTTVFVFVCHKHYRKVVHAIKHFHMRRTALALSQGS